MMGRRLNCLRLGSASSLGMVLQRAAKQSHVSPRRIEGNKIRWGVSRPTEVLVEVWKPTLPFEKQAWDKGGTSYQRKLGKREGACCISRVPALKVH